MRLFYLLCLLAVPCALLPAAAPPAGPSKADVARLVAQLRDKDTARRTAATERLKLAGEAALPALRKALADDDPDVRLRAQAIVSAIERRLDERLRLTGHPFGVFCVSTSADGKRLLTTGNDGTLCLWEADTGKRLRVITRKTRRFEAGLFPGALSADGKRILSGGRKVVYLWDAESGKQLRAMTGHTRDVASVAFGPEGKAALGRAHDGTMRLWDLDSGKSVRTFRGHEGIVFRVAYSDKAKLAATSGFDNTIRLWDLDTGKSVRRIDSEDAVADVCFSPDGKLLLTAGLHSTTCIWDVATGDRVKQFDLGATCAAFSPDGKRLAFGSTGGAVHVREVATGKAVREYLGHEGFVRHVVFFPDGGRLATACDDGARVWRAPLR